MSTTAARRPKWHYPPPPTPRIIHLPRRPRRKQLQPKNNPDRKGKLEALFDQERTFSKTGVPVVLLEYNETGRERVESCGGGGDASEEDEKWRFQAEMLRAECNLLRMEREIALKKLERTRTQMQRTLRSTVQTLITGRNKMSEGKSLGVVLEEEIQELVEKLDKLQRRSLGGGAKDLEGRSCSNFDKQASLLQRRLQKFGGAMSSENCANGIREMAEASLSINTSCRVDESFVSSRKCNDVQLEVLKRKMEGLSKGMLLEKMEEEYGSLLSTANSSAVSSASTSKRIEVPDMPCSTSFRQPHQESVCRDETVCSGRCKVIVRRIVEQVRAETEQWSQMQEMLGQVREEMEELQASRDFWEDRALDSGSQIQSLHSSVQEWREKAISYETKANELQARVCLLQREVQELRKEQNGETRAKGLPPIPREAPNEMEKRVLICRLKENRRSNDTASNCKQKEVMMGEGRRKSFNGGVMGPKRTPFGDIGNSSPLVRQRSKAIFPLPSNSE